MPARRRALVASLLLPSLLFVALASGCLVWYVAEDPFSGDAIDAGSGDADAGDTGACLPSQKLCVGKCADQSDPSVGCSGECTACDTPPNAAPACKLQGSNEECALGACNAPFADCDRDASDGCEAELTTTENCGLCGVDCTPLPYCIPTQDGGDGYVCSSTCPNPPFLPCNSECIDPLRDAKNCSTCGHDCTASNGDGICDAGVCELTCHNGYCLSANGKKCVLPGGSSPNCGACGVDCRNEPGGKECCTKGGVSSCMKPLSGPSDAAAPPGGAECNP